MYTCMYVHRHIHVHICDLYDIYTLMQRWLKSWGIQIASEKQLRRVSDELLGDNLEGEEAPFCFPARSGVDIRPAPLVYIPDLVGKVTQMLDQNDK